MKFPEGSPESVWGAGALTDVLYRGDPTDFDPQAERKTKHEPEAETEQLIVGYPVVQNLGRHHYQKVEGGYVDRPRRPDSE